MSFAERAAMEKREAEPGTGRSQWKRSVNEKSA
jgi:hypothetical protein